MMKAIIILMLMIPAIMMWQMPMDMDYDVEPLWMDGEDENILSTNNPTMEALGQGLDRAQMLLQGANEQLGQARKQIERMIIMGEQLGKPEIKALGQRLMPMRAQGEGLMRIQAEIAQMKRQIQAN